MIMWDRISLPDFESQKDAQDIDDAAWEEVYPKYLRDKYREKYANHIGNNQRYDDGRKSCKFNLLRDFTGKEVIPKNTPIRKISQQSLTDE